MKRYTCSRRHPLLVSHCHKIPLHVFCAGFASVTSSTCTTTKSCAGQITRSECCLPTFTNIQTDLLKSRTRPGFCHHHLQLQLLLILHHLPQHLHIQAKDTAKGFPKDFLRILSPLRPPVHPNAETWTPCHPYPLSNRWRNEQLSPYEAMVRKNFQKTFKKKKHSAVDLQRN